LLDYLVHLTVMMLPPGVLTSGLLCVVECVSRMKTWAGVSWYDINLFAQLDQPTAIPLVLCANSSSHITRRGASATHQRSLQAQCSHQQSFATKAMWDGLHTVHHKTLSCLQLSALWQFVLQHSSRKQHIEIIFSDILHEDSRGMPVLDSLGTSSSQDCHLAR
jgi:hypothetical protein